MAPTHLVAGCGRRPALRGQFQHVWLYEYGRVNRAFGRAFGFRCVVSKPRGAPLPFSKAAEEWSRCINVLNRWEEEHLLVDQPSPEKLAQHKKIVERLMFFGQLCVFIGSHPEFDDPDSAGMVFAKQQVLRDKLRMFHNPMTQEEADRILKEVFPEP